MGGSYYLIYDWMTEELGLRGNERDVFAVIYGFSESGGTFTGGLQYLCRRIGASKPTVMGSLRRLQEKKLLHKQERFENGVKYCTYRVNTERVACFREQGSSLPETGKNLSCPMQESLPGGGKDPSHPMQESLPGAGRELSRPGQKSFPNNKEYNKENNKKENKEREARAPVRSSYGEYGNVLLSKEDLAALQREFPDDWRKKVDRLSEYMASTGKTYRNHLATIRAWARQDAPQEPPEKKAPPPIPGGLRL